MSFFVHCAIGTVILHHPVHNAKQENHFCIVVIRNTPKIKKFVGKGKEPFVSVSNSTELEINLF